MPKYNIERPKSAAAEEIIHTMEIESEAHKRQKRADAAEAKRRAEGMQTQGRRGAKLPRISSSITPSNFEFLKIMSRIEGVPMTKIINNVLADAREAMEKNPTDIYTRAKELFTEADSAMEDKTK